MFRKSVDIFSTWSTHMTKSLFKAFIMRGSCQYYKSIKTKTKLNIFLLGHGIYRIKYSIGKEIAKLYNEYSITVN